MKKVLFILIIILSIVSVIVLQEGGKLETKDGLTEIKIPLYNCRPQKKSCDAESDKIRVKIVFDENIYYLKPFNFSVLTSNKMATQIKTVKVNFKMKSMDMGVNIFTLNKSINNKQKWTGTALLPVCMTGQADWLSELEVVTKQNKYVFLFPIEVKKAAD